MAGKRGARARDRLRELGHVLLRGQCRVRQRERALGCGRAVVDDGRGRGHRTAIVVVGVRGAEDGDLRLLLADHVEEAVLCGRSVGASIADEVFGKLGGGCVGDLVGTYDLRLLLRF